MRIAITGSNGFVGNFLCEFFSKKGIPVLGLDLGSMERQSKYKNFTFVKCDIRDKKKLLKALLEHQTTHVIHLAYLMDPQHDRLFEDDVDVNGSKAIFDAANKIPTVRQFIHFSSASVYGGFPDNKAWITEEQKPRPRDWVYAQNKVTAEKYYFSAKKNFKLVNLRMCTAVGPSYYKEGGVVKTLAKTPLGLLLDGKDTLLQFIHEEDVKALIQKIVADDTIEGTFNLAPDSYASTKQLNGKKFFVKLPKWFFKGVISALWHTRIAPVSPTSVNLVAHGIVVTPKKLMERYNYNFKYTTKQAYIDSVKKRLQNGTL